MDRVSDFFSKLSFFSPSAPPTPVPQDPLPLSPAPSLPPQSPQPLQQPKPSLSPEATGGHITKSRWKFFLERSFSKTHFGPTNFSSFNTSIPFPTYHREETD
eukprot:TRINITY_DN6947_c0_g1_i3.p1 TRINITY_DN6947_c0_g1~~TRINITY_DN6947_c0_g1_i3.p1  ORF type:complete len:102 (-),score=33.77 TRINITY_DN6947_c0_g1_i3:250-555(-)